MTRARRAAAGARPAAGDLPARGEPAGAKARARPPRRSRRGPRGFRSRSRWRFGLALWLWALRFQPIVTVDGTECAIPSPADRRRQALRFVFPPGYPALICCKAVVAGSCSRRRWSRWCAARCPAADMVAGARGRGAAVGGAARAGGRAHRAGAILGAHDVGSATPCFTSRSRWWRRDGRWARASGSARRSRCVQGAGGRRGCSGGQLVRRASRPTAWCAPRSPRPDSRARGALLDLLSRYARRVDAHSQDRGVARDRHRLAHRRRRLRLEAPHEKRTERWSCCSERTHRAAQYPKNRRARARCSSCGWPCC
jgi:hypothetical protein